MCDHDLIEYYQLLQEESEKIDKKISKLDEKFKELYRDESANVAINIGECTTT